MIEIHTIKDVIELPLRAVGFMRKGSSWYLSTPDSACVVDLQRSDYGKRYYLNIAIWLNALGDAVTPKEHLCHIRCRATSLPGVDAADLERLLNLEDDSVPDTERAEQLGDILREYVVPFVEKVSDLRTLRSEFREKRLPRSCLIHRDARALLNQEANLK